MILQTSCAKARGPLGLWNDGSLQPCWRPWFPEGNCGEKTTEARAKMQKQMLDMHTLPENVDSCSFSSPKAVDRSPSIAVACTDNTPESHDSLLRLPGSRTANQISLVHGSDSSKHQSTHQASHLKHKRTNRLVQPVVVYFSGGGHLFSSRIRFFRAGEYQPLLINHEMR